MKATIDIENVKLIWDGDIRRYFWSLWITVTTRETLNYKFNPIPLSAKLEWQNDDPTRIQISGKSSHKNQLKQIYMRPRLREILSGLLSRFLIQDAATYKEKEDSPTFSTVRYHRFLYWLALSNLHVKFNPFSYQKIVSYLRIIWCFSAGVVCNR